MLWKGSDLLGDKFTAGKYMLVTKAQEMSKISVEANKTTGLRSAQHIKADKLCWQCSFQLLIHITSFKINCNHIEERFDVIVESSKKMCIIHQDTEEIARIPVELNGIESSERFTAMIKADA